MIDPGQNLSAVRDVAILHGRVARIAENIPHAQARSVFDATDKIVTPGLIDMHSHVYEYGTPLGVNSDRVKAGVTTIVDCGTTGAAMFPGSGGSSRRGAHADLRPPEYLDGRLLHR